MQIEMLLAQKKPKISAAKSKPCGKGATPTFAFRKTPIAGKPEYACNFRPTFQKCLVIFIDPNVNRTGAPVQEEIQPIWQPKSFLLEFIYPVAVLLDILKQANLQHGIVA